MMIISYDPEKLELRMNGHAAAAPKGQDIVCAAASILLYTVAENLRRAEERGQLKGTPFIRISEGEAQISCSPKNAYVRGIEHMFESVCTGFQLLADCYPENVVFELGTRN